MNRFTLEIRLGNEAMQTPADVADALDRLGHRLRNYPSTAPVEGAIRDPNGNTVGEWQFAFRQEK